jgi:hypothetical protein
MPMMLVYALIPVGLSIWLRKSTFDLMLAFIFSAILYAVVYARLIHFRWVIPKLRLTKRSSKNNC